MTELQFRQYDEALTAAGGDRQKAAAILGIPRKTLKEQLQTNAILKEKWIEKRDRTPDRGVAPPVVEALISRESPARSPVPVSEKELDLIVNLAEEDKKFKNDMKGLRLNEEEMDMALSLQRFQGRHFAKTVDLITGGMSVTSLRLMSMIEKLVKRLNGRFQDVTDGEITVEGIQQEKMCWEAFHRCCESLLHMSKSATDGAVARARIEMWKKTVQNSAGQTPMRKPGFSPQGAQVYVDVANGANLHVNSGLADALMGKNDPKPNGHPD